MYKPNKPTPTTICVNKHYEGESIEAKIRRVVNNKEPISDGAPLILFNAPLTIQLTSGPQDTDRILIMTQERGLISMTELCTNITFPNDIHIIGSLNATLWGTINILYISDEQGPFLTTPRVITFPLDNIDTARERILSTPSKTTPFDVMQELGDLEPYSWIQNPDAEGNTPLLASQDCLLLKTYQSDLFNNWLNTEWIDGPSGVSAVTSVDTSGDSFTIDSLNLAKKVYDMLNRIMVSGGTYNDWLDAVYAHERYQLAETPMYMGGLIKELVFQEVVSNSSASTSQGEQPLATLAGKGILGKKHKGGKVVIKIDEPSYIIGIVSLTPRIDYSQGNKWDVHLMTLDDLHKPQLDQIGFQDLLTEQMAWWSTDWNGIQYVTRAAGKQPAWINYMTNVGKQPAWINYMTNIIS